MVIISSENVPPDTRSNYSSSNLIIAFSFVTKPDILSSDFVYQYRCLEEGAQEFMLKPIKQSDVKKLRCHMTKVTKPCSGWLCIRRNNSAQWQDYKRKAKEKIEAEIDYGTIDY